MESYTDYLMLLAPPANIRYDIDRYKRASARVIGNFDGMRSPAHVSVNRMHRCKPYLTRHAISQMGDKLGLLTPQELQIYDFKYFEHGKTGATIYACVMLNEQVNRWFKGLRNSMRIIHKLDVPHITIAKNIPVDKFKLLWPKFEQCRYRSSFVADKLVILERETYVTHQPWRNIKEIRFGEKLMEY